MANPEYSKEIPLLQYYTYGPICPKCHLRFHIEGVDPKLVIASDFFSYNCPHCDLPVLINTSNNQTAIFELYNDPARLFKRAKDLIEGGISPEKPWWKFW